MFTKPKKPDNQQICESIFQASRIRSTVKANKCPNCDQKTLELTKFTEGKDGFEAEVTCTNQCGLSGVINSTGFTFNLGKKKAQL